MKQKPAQKRTILKEMEVCEIVQKTVVRSGNGGAVWVPKRWLGEKVVVVLPRQ